jgi:hypothetical protein
MQCYDNKNAFGGFISDVFIQNQLRSYFTLLRSFRSYFTRVPILQRLSLTLESGGDTLVSFRQVVR